MLIELTKLATWRNLELDLACAKMRRITTLSLAPLFRAFTNIRYVCLDEFWDNYEETTSNFRYCITVLAIV